jgi:hypothetical protein
MSVFVVVAAAIVVVPPDMASVYPSSTNCVR